MGKVVNIPVVTLIQPWASWIAEGLKTIETRTHTRFSSLVGKTIGIHAGLKFDPHALTAASNALDIDFQRKSEKGILQAEDVRKRFDKMCRLEIAADYPQGFIIATAKVEGFRALSTRDSGPALIDCKNHQRYGLLLTDVRKITPIPAKGKQGVWYHEVEI